MRSRTASAHPAPSSGLALSPRGGHTFTHLTLPRLLPALLFGVVEQTLFKVLPEFVSVRAAGQVHPELCPSSPRFELIWAPGRIRLCFPSTPIR